MVRKTQRLTGRKLTAMLMALIMLLSSCMTVFAGQDQPTGTPVADGSEGNTPTRTIMMYISGCELESEDGRASLSIEDILYSDYDENTNIIAMTGGSTDWYVDSSYLLGVSENSISENSISENSVSENGTDDEKYVNLDQISTDKIQIWKIEGKKKDQDHGYMYLLGDICDNTKYGMNNPYVLNYFINICCEYYPADLYDLILWDHGGGPVSGFCEDNVVKGIDNGMMMDLYDLAFALADTSLIQSDKKFELLTFDGGLMSNTDVAAVLGLFAENMVFTPEPMAYYGLDYVCWLKDLKENPYVTGFESGKNLVDHTLEDYFQYWYDSTETGSSICVVNSKNFAQRLLPQLINLDNIAINEATTKGENGRYNFYDEIFSRQGAYSYDMGKSSLYDLGNYVGMLSIPQSELDNISDEDIMEFRNVYTDTALKILEILGDNDGSDDDVIYTRSTEQMKNVVEGAYIRDTNGKILSPGADGIVTLPTTGISIFCSDDNYTNSLMYSLEMAMLSDCAEADNPAEAALKKYLTGRSNVTAYYGLINASGRCVSELINDPDEDITSVSIDTIKELYGEWIYKIFFEIYYMVIYRNENPKGSVDGLNDYLATAEKYVEDILKQQNAEVVSSDGITVRKLYNKDGSSDSYQVTVGNTSSQAFMSVDSSVKLKSKAYDSDDYEKFLDFFYYPDGVEKYFPAGININAGINKGSFDFNQFYESPDDTYSQLMRRIYSSSSTVWEVPEMTEDCFVLYDNKGKAHAADIYYLDATKKAACIPIQLMKNYYEDDYWFYDGFLYIYYKDGEWIPKGISISDKADKEFLDKIQATEEGIKDADAEINGYIYPLDSLFFNDIKFATMTLARDEVEKLEYYMPFGDFADIGQTTDNEGKKIPKEDWGISFGYEKASKLKEDGVIADKSAGYYVQDIYGYRIDISDLFEQADKDAEDGKEGAVAYDINLAEVEVNPVVYNGKAQSAPVTVTHNGKTLTKDKDYKVIGSELTDVGQTYIRISGIGNYTGIRSAVFTVDQADPEYDLPEGLKAVYGDTLADIKLPEGWAWDNKTKSVGNVGENKFSATFTPADTKNYKTVNADLTVKVEAKSNNQGTGGNNQGSGSNITPAPSPTPSPSPAPTESKQENTATVTAKTTKVNVAKLQTKGAAISIKVKDANGDVTYKLVKKSVPKKMRKFVTITKKGKIKIKPWKDAKPGTYKFKVKVKVAGDANHKEKTITKVIKIKVK